MLCKLPYTLPSQREFGPPVHRRWINTSKPWSSAAKSMLPGNTKCSMTSLADTKNIYSWKDLRRIEFCSWLRPRAVSRLLALRARRDYKVATLGIRMRLFSQILLVMEYAVQIINLILNYYYHLSIGKVQQKLQQRKVKSRHSSTI